MFIRLLQKTHVSVLFKDNFANASFDVLHSTQDLMRAMCMQETRTVMMKD